MNLSEREQRFLDELHEAFPDAREIPYDDLNLHLLVAKEMAAIEYPVQPVAALTLWEGMNDR